MAKIKWSKMPDFFVWNKLRSLRKERKLTQIDVAKGTGLSLTWIAYAEKGYDDNISDQAKQKIADFFEVDIDDVFPAEMVGNQPRKERKQQVQFFAEPEIEKGEAFLIMLKGVGRDLKLEEGDKLFYREVITKMTLAEISQRLFGPGITVGEIKKTIERFAKKYGVKSPQ